MTKTVQILMCPPDHFDITYQINPWMKPASANQKLAWKQWLKLKKLIESFLKAKVEIIPAKPSLPDMVFSSDQGIILGKTFLQANFSYHQRQPESHHYNSWFKKNGFHLAKLPSQFKFEGGDFLLWKDKILAGYGFRTQKVSHSKIARIFQKEVISLQLVDPFFYHLDLALFPLDPKTLIYYPAAFSSSSCRLLSKIAPTIIKASRQDAFNFALNSFVLGKKILAHPRLDGLLSQLSSRGFQILQTDVSEFQKAGGGIHCLALQLNSSI